MKKVKGLMTLISLALVARILISFIISRMTLAQMQYDKEYHSLFDAKTKLRLPEVRSKEYCNAPGDMIDGLEGIPSKPGMNLLGTVVLVRHGDRLPISRPPAFKGIAPPKNMPCKLDPLAYPSSRILKDYLESIKKYSSIIKNSVNPVMHDFDLLPDTCSDVSVTQTGIVQMLELGRFLGKRYIDQRPRNLQEFPQEVTTSTSRFARTFQSLLPLVYGFSTERFSEFVGRKIGTSSSLYFCDSDSSSTPPYFAHCDCLKAKKIPELRATFRDWDMRKEQIAHLHTILKINDQSRLSSEQVHGQSSKIGPPPLSIASPSRIWDWLVAEYYCPERPLPCLPSAANAICLNSSIVEALIHLVDKNHFRMITDREYVKATSLAMYPLLNTINAKFHQLVRERKQKSGSRTGKSPFVWVLSGHDITIGPLFVALDMPLLKKAPYATRVAFELWGDSKDPNGRGLEPYIRTLLNGVDVTNRINACRTKAPMWKFYDSDSNFIEHESPCPLSRFDKFVNSDFFEDFPTNEYKTACHL